MPSALDAAKYILERQGAMTTMKLQKLVYYSQVWSIVWDDDVLFPEPIEAWKNGPVVRALWDQARGRFRIEAASIEGDSAQIANGQRNTIDRVLAAYGDKDAQWLSDLTHLEQPWQTAFRRAQNTEIDLAEISEYYSSLGPNDAKAV